MTWGIPARSSSCSSAAWLGQLRPTNAMRRGRNLACNQAAVIVERIREAQPLEDIGNELSALASMSPLMKLARFEGYRSRNSLGQRSRICRWKRVEQYMVPWMADIRPR